MDTGWKCSEPTCLRTTEHTIKALQNFQGPEERVSWFYCDGAPELKAVCMGLGIMNPTSTPGCPETNGLAEQGVKDIKDGTRANLIQSGCHAPPCVLPLAMAQVLSSEGKPTSNAKWIQ